VKWLTHPSRFAPLKLRQAGTRTGTGTRVPDPGGNMAPKPASARFAYVFGMVLAVAAIILGITTRNLAAPSASLIYRPDLPLLY